MTRDLGGAKIYLKREDLNHTGAHKINNVLGQALLAKKMGKTSLIVEIGAGQHGVATATALCPLFGMECKVFMGEEDTIRQALNVYRMKLLGAEVVPVKSGTATLKDAVSEAMREWTSRISDTHYCLGSVMGPHPPTIVRDFQAVLLKRNQGADFRKEGKLPDAVLACRRRFQCHRKASVYRRQEVSLIGCEARRTGTHHETAATIATGKLGIFHGMKSLFLPGRVWTDCLICLFLRDLITLASGLSMLIFMILAVLSMCRLQTKKLYVPLSIWLRQKVLFCH